MVAPAARRGEEVYQARTAKEGEGLFDQELLASKVLSCSPPLCIPNLPSCEFTLKSKNEQYIAAVMSPSSVPSSSAMAHASQSYTAPATSVAPETSKTSRCRYTEEVLAWPRPKPLSRARTRNWPLGSACSSDWAATCGFLDALAVGLSYRGSGTTYSAR